MARSVIDSGRLLHFIRWKKNASYADVLGQYSSFPKTKYGMCCVLFDGYEYDGSIRVCLDPRQLNKALIRPRHKAPTLDDLNHKFANAKFFSKLDAKAGYWSIKLDEESQKLTTFQTPFGRYCFLRLPFGLSVSQDILIIIIMKAFL